MDIFYFVFVFTLMSCLCLVALGSHGKGLISWLSCMDVLLCFCHFPIRCPGCPELGMLLDCIDS